MIGLNPILLACEIGSILIVVYWHSQDRMGISYSVLILYIIMIVFSVLTGFDSLAELSGCSTFQKFSDAEFHPLINPCV